MDRTRWNRIESLFHQLRELPCADRSAALHEQCADDPSLAREISALLDADVTRTLTARGAIAAELGAISRLSAVAQLGRRIGAFRLISLLGQGAMGAVYLAERDDDEFRQRVAIKLLPCGLPARSLGERLRNERQILATLEHPGIVRLLDGGTDDDGTPYLVMEYVRGTTITRYATAAGLGVREKVALVREVCAALEHAHQRFVAHRDIKPSNVLVDESGAPKILDFGIATLLAEAPAPARDLIPIVGELAFTPPYASPEQVRGARATAASDVYSVGAVLYELLTGAPPLPCTGDLAAFVRAVAEREPEAASQVAPARDRRAIAGDLDCILRRALHKDPDRRYASVAALRADLDSHLARRPVAAHPPSLGYWARKLLARNRGAFAVTAVVTCVLSVLAAALAQHTEHRDCVAATSRAAAAVEDARAASLRAERLPITLERIAAMLEQAQSAWPPMRAELRRWAAGDAHSDEGPEARALALVSEAARLLRDVPTCPVRALTSPRHHD